MQKVTLFDGGMGQELVKRNSHKKDPLWSSKVLIDNPNSVMELHKEFLDAGASVISLNSYSCTPQRLKRLDLENKFEELQLQSIKAAKEALNSNLKYKDVKIAGCLPPLEGSYKSKIGISKKEALETYKEIVNIQKNDVDFFICETMSSISEALIAYEASSVIGKPILMSFCVSEKDGKRLISEEKLFDACINFQNKKLLGFSINCCQFEVVEHSIEIFKKFSLPYGVFPNGFKTVENLKPGMSVNVLEKRIDVNPSMFVDYGIRWFNSGCSFVGGCCEIGPDLIKSLDNEMKRLKFTRKSII